MTDLSVMLHGLRLRGESHAADIIEAQAAEIAALLERLNEAYRVGADGWRKATEQARQVQDWEYGVTRTNRPDEVAYPQRDLASALRFVADPPLGIYRQEGVGFIAIRRRRAGAWEVVPGV